MTRLKTLGLAVALGWAAPALAGPPAKAEVKLGAGKAAAKPVKVRRGKAEARPMICKRTVQCKVGRVPVDFVQIGGPKRTAPDHLECRYEAKKSSTYKGLGTRNCAKLQIDPSKCWLPKGFKVTGLQIQAVDKTITRGTRTRKVGCNLVSELKLSN